MKSYLFLAPGFEEVEALTTVDVMRRGGMDVVTVSIEKSAAVTGANHISVNADMILGDGSAITDADWLICPGGMPGASNLAANSVLCDLLKRHFAAGGRVAAICAAPAVVLAPLHILDGRRATCYPGFEDACSRAGLHDVRVSVDGNLITANGPSSAILFGLAILEASRGAAVAEHVGKGLLLRLDSDGRWRF